MWEWYPAGRVLGVAVAAVGPWSPRASVALACPSPQRPWFRHGSGCGVTVVARAGPGQLYFNFTWASIGLDRACPQSIPSNHGSLHGGPVLRARG